MTKVALAGLILAFLVVWKPQPQAGQAGQPARPVHAHTLFQQSAECLACHNNIVTSSGEDVSIGTDWSASIMAHSARDPYWQAAVRREVMDHPAAAGEIEDECSICHMPMARAQANAESRPGTVFNHLPAGGKEAAESRLAADGVSCTMCHQITDRKLGTAESFSGGFVVDLTRRPEERQIFGRFKIDEGRTPIMKSAAGFLPTEAAHIEQSELCATCHTLYTKPLVSGVPAAGELPEQVMYLEWRHSEFRESKSCQACHMPAVAEETPISSVLGELRKGFARHVFRGGNFFMLRMLNRYRNELGVVAPAAGLEAASARTIQFLKDETAEIAIDRAAASNGRLEIDVAVRNLAGHKFPTGYPSRRAWLRLAVRDRNGRTLFESGLLNGDGSIQGNDNDADAARFEPHYEEIGRSDQVQIYESTMGDAGGAVTTGLLTAVRFVKDNRLLPRGFDKASAEPDIAVVGAASGDRDFVGGSDRVRYSIAVEGADAPFQIEAELLFQPISFRWAANLRPYRSAETARFVAYYDSMSAVSAEVIARARQLVP